MTLTFSRPPKLSHIDTVHYEIYMLRHAISRLAEQKLTERDAWMIVAVRRHPPGRDGVKDACPLRRLQPGALGPRH